MTSPRGEAIKKTLSGDTFIQSPEHNDEAGNKIDHYGVLGQVIHAGLSRFIEDNSNHLFQEAKSIHELKNLMQSAVLANITQVMADPHFSQHFNSLQHSQTERSTLHDDMHRRIESNMQAGIETFVNLFELLAEILGEAFGKEAASHPGNWKIVDRIAKLHIELFGPYVNTYFHEAKNNVLFIDQLQISNDGSLQFAANYPREAEVSVHSTQARYRLIMTRDDFILNESQETIRLNEIELKDPEIGCPITFYPNDVRELWRIFAESAQSIEVWEDERLTLARQAIKRAQLRLDDIEASAE